MSKQSHIGKKNNKRSNDLENITHKTKDDTSVKSLNHSKDLKKTKFHE
jgi:hypothetical protein